jgi:biotin carboxyl carrier protein
MKKQITMQYQGETFTVDAERKGDEIEISRGGKTYTVHLLPEKKSEPVSRPSAPAPRTPVTPVTPAAQAPPAGAAGAIVAPMTGLVKEVFVVKGDQVTNGQLVVMMEAMKMDIEVTAAHDGSVVEVFVQPNTNISQGQPLISIG